MVPTQPDTQYSRNYQTQLPVASYPVASYPVASAKQKLGSTKSNDAVTHASIATRSCSSSRNTIPLATGSSILRLVILSRAQRLPDATQAQQLLFHFHQLQATVTIKFQILPVVGYSTADSIFGGIRQLLIFKFTWLNPNNKINHYQSLNPHTRSLSNTIVNIIT
ncbi:hypothetical protein F511_17721 [Dorcoceras hygrometricum]|uniref:Uncharacterized protein n=1 Tax=Dorcoceras hygrometricum TaxID=472368 RepID=A0A2Z7BU51_9LAMI|nr:hypothetical protein F511_17721 [Dorcoceras hygrometricum]